MFYFGGLWGFFSRVSWIFSHVFLICSPCPGSPDTSGGFTSDGDDELLSSIEAAHASSPLSLSDESEQFDIEIEELECSLLHSEPDENPTVTMSANREDVAETPAAEPGSPSLGATAVPLPRPQEIFTPVHDGGLPGARHLAGGVYRFNIGTIIKKFPIPPPLRVPIYGSVPSPGSPTLDGLHPIFYGEDSRVGRYAFYGEFAFSLPSFLSGVFYSFVVCLF